MSKRRINPIVDTFRGVNNALNPCSAQYRQFMAFVCKNSRINDSGLWDKAAALGNVVSGATQTDLPEDLTGTDDLHFKEAFIKGTQIIVGKLNWNTSIDVGPNKYAYYVDPALDSGEVKWWDGAGSTEFTDWDKAGMGKPDASVTAAIGTIGDAGGTVTVDTSAAHTLSTGDRVTITNTTNFKEAFIKGTQIIVGNTYPANNPARVFIGPGLG